MNTKSTNKIGFVYFTVLGIGIFFALWLQVNLKLSYHLQQPLFLMDSYNLKESFATPGGFTHYISNFLSELYALPLIGSVSTTLLILLLPALLYIEIRKKSSVLIALISSSTIAIVSTLLFTNYAFQIALLLLLTLAYLSTLLQLKLFKQLKSVAAFIVLLIPLMYLNYLFLGGLGLLLSGLFFAIKVFKTNKERKLKTTAIIVILITYAVIPFILVKTTFQLVPLGVSYLNNLFFDDHYTISKLYFAVIGITILLVLISGFKLQVKSSKWIIPAMLCFTLLIISSAAKILRSNTTTKLLEIDHHAYNKNWDAVLNLCDQDILSNQMATFHANRAIYFSKNLLNDAFSIQQNFRQNALLLEQNVNPSMLVNTSDIYFDLGIINESRHWIHEAFTSLGMQPRILKRMVETNIILGKYNTAKKYIGLLKKSPLNKKWALKYNGIIDGSSTVKDFPLLADKNANLPSSDFFMNRHMPVSNLINYIEQPGMHKMALEYLVSSYLFDRNVIKVLKQVHFFRKYKYDALPRLVQEALILYVVKTQTNTIHISGYSITDQNFKRFNEYSKLYTLYKNHDKAAKKKLDKEYSNSFWYYIHFTSPLTKS